MLLLLLDWEGLRARLDVEVVDVVVIYDICHVWRCAGRLVLA